MKPVGKDTLLNALGAAIVVAAVVIVVDATDVDLTKVIDLNVLVKGIADIK